MMSPDSQDQWNQILNHKFTNAHPVFHTLSNWLLTRLWLSPACVAAAQIAALSSLVGCGISHLRRVGMPRRLAVVTAMVFAVLPANATMVVTLWKDVPYSIALLLLSLLMLKMTLTEGAWIGRPWVWGRGTDCDPLALYPHKVLPSLWKPGFAACHVPRQTAAARDGAGLSVALHWGVTGPLYQALDVTLTPGRFEPFPCSSRRQDTVAGTPVTDEERAFLNRLYPLKDGHWPYSPYDVTQLMFNRTFDHQLLAQDKWRLLRLWLGAHLEESVGGTGPFAEQQRRGLGHSDAQGVYLICERVGNPRQGSLSNGFAPGRSTRGRVEARYPEGRTPASSRAVAGRVQRLVVALLAPSLPMYLLFFGVIVAVLRSGNARYLCVAAPCRIPVGGLGPVLSVSGVSLPVVGFFTSALLLSGFLLSSVRRKARVGLSASEPQERPWSQNAVAQLAVDYPGIGTTSESCPRRTATTTFSSARFSATRAMGAAGN